MLHSHNWLFQFGILLEGDLVNEKYKRTYTKCWKKITSEQFKHIYLAVLKDIQNPDLDDNKESNWNVVSESIMNSSNKRE